MSRDPASSRADVAVVGAGPAGTAAAIALRQCGVARVLVIDSGEAGDFRIGESVPPDIRPLLASLGVLDSFLADGHAPCLGSVSCWGSDWPGHNDFIFNPHGHGWHLDRPRFERMMRAAARQAGAVILSGQRVLRARDDEGNVHLDLSEGGTAAARWVIDATGQQARIARHLGAQRDEDDRLICVCRFLTLPQDRPLDRLSHLEGVAEGWWYAADLGGGRAVAMIATDRDSLTRGGLAQIEGWQAALARTTHLAPLLKGSRPTEGAPDPQVRIAPSARLWLASGRNWLAAGDAAASYDPLSAQGIAQALVTGRAAGIAGAAALAGDGAAAPGYARAMADNYAGYLANRAHVYAAETRWPASSFWTARRAALVPDANTERRAG